MCSIIIFGGNVLFGLIISNFNEMMDEIKNFVYEHDDAEKLNRFFALLSRFNKGKAINEDLRKFPHKKMNVFLAIITTGV